MLIITNNTVRVCLGSESGLARFERYLQIVNDFFFLILSRF